MANVPFYPNTADGTHCVQAAFKTMLKYFRPERDFSFAELDMMSHKKPGKGTWWLPLLFEISKLGIKVKDIEPFDFARFYREGEPYVRSFYPKEAADYHLDHTNLGDIRHSIPDFLNKVDLENRPAKFRDLINLLNDGWLVGLAVNSRVLNGRAGFSGHVVVVYSKLGNDYFILHDPGLPPIEARKVSQELLSKAWLYAGSKTASLSAIKMT